MGHVKGVTVQNHLLIFRIASARIKAREAAVAEALALLMDLQPQALAGGPLSDQKGVFWIRIPEETLEPALLRLPRLGYTDAVDLLQPSHESEWRRRAPDFVSWQKQLYHIERIYQANQDYLRERAPDKRDFILEMESGELRTVTGYRGDGKTLSRRALPVIDACLLVNLVFKPTGGNFLDPFGGAGGVIVEAVTSGYHVFSGDIDPTLRHGLSRLGASHSIANALRLPFADDSINAIATEPPYDRDVTPLVVDSLAEMTRVLKTDSRIAMLCARWQAEALRQQGIQLKLRPILDSEINRKGTDCTVLAWEKLEANG
ncbi:MAG: hypothetical protein H7Y09_12685 [Chitinophagaceae bacterium]|nr:hypothetical protein [Anaerolineae bacterium]